MTAKEQMKFVDETTCGISTRLGALSREGVLSVEDSMKIIMFINDKQTKWIEGKFTSSEIYDFVYK